MHRYPGAGAGGQHRRSRKMRPAGTGSDVPPGSGQGTTGTGGGRREVVQSASAAMVLAISARTAGNAFMIFGTPVSGAAMARVASSVAMATAGHLKPKDEVFR